MAYFSLKMLGNALKSANWEKFSNADGRADGDSARDDEDAERVKVGHDKFKSKTSSDQI